MQCFLAHGGAGEEEHGVGLAGPLGVPDDADLSPAGVGPHGAGERPAYGVKLVCFGEDLHVGLAALIGTGAHEEGEASHHVE